jgi:rRNA-processing protein FCF1
MKRIILDTNFLLIPYQFKVDIFSEIERICSFKYKLCVMDKTLDELDKIVKEQKGKNRHAAMLGVMLLAQKGAVKIKSKKKKVDDAIVEEASKGDCIVATQDAELKRKLKKKGISLIVLKQKSHLGLI